MNKKEYFSDIKLLNPNRIIDVYNLINDFKYEISTKSIEFETKIHKNPKRMYASISLDKIKNNDYISLLVSVKPNYIQEITGACLLG